ncbi:MAG: 23S rRNA (adenine(2503)-C(2))-methyltransferase RlmN [Clostridia bacterium]|nr:23S rRNA (adenine(2503)-C(2))-methyltransferase RlmN [Clostridia bacterium]
MEQRKKIDIVSLNFEELRAAVAAMGEPKFRADQIYQWLHVRGASDFSEMTNISKALREKLNDNFVIFSCAIEKKLVSCYDDTVKYLFRLADGEFVETVVMKYKYGWSICVSCQVGCKMRCAFCASTLGGCVRNLRVSEILGQVYAAGRDLGVRISHIVMMGMGEPLDNYDNAVKFISMVSDAHGLHISARNISLSTCGIVPKIYELADLKSGITLSVSLHAPNDEIRSRIMPVNKRWNMEALLAAVRRYIAETGRRVSFEYTMIRGVNDAPAHARELAARLRGMLCHVNLIPVNTVRETGLQATHAPEVQKFKAALERGGINVTVRRTLGADINASCGQLRKSAKQTDANES